MPSSTPMALYSAKIRPWPPFKRLYACFFERFAEERAGASRRSISHPNKSLEHNKNFLTPSLTLVRYIDAPGCLPHEFTADDPCFSEKSVAGLGLDFFQPAFPFERFEVYVGNTSDLNIIQSQVALDMNCPAFVFKIGLTEIT